MTQCTENKESHYLGNPGSHLIGGVRVEIRSCYPSFVRTVVNPVMFTEREREDWKRENGSAICARANLPTLATFGATQVGFRQGGVKSTPSSPRLRVGVILTDPDPVKEAH